MIFRQGFNGGNCIGCEWIIAEGTIQQDTPEVFRKFLEEKKPAGGVRINSPGGNLLAGLKFGEMIRSAVSPPKSGEQSVSNHLSIQTRSKKKSTKGPTEFALRRACMHFSEGLRGLPLNRRSVFISSTMVRL